MKHAAACGLALWATLAHAGWKFQVTVDGTPRAAEVRLHRPLEPVGSSTPCLVPRTDLPRGAPVLAERCQDAASARRLVELARKFKPAPVVKSLETDDTGRGTVEVKGEYDVVVSALDVEAHGRFRVDTSVGVETQLALFSRTREERQTLDRLQQRWAPKSSKPTLWVLGVGWPQVVPPGGRPWSELELPRGEYVVVSEDGADRFWLELPAGRATGRERQTRGTVTRGGKPARGVQVIALHHHVLARETTDAKGSFPFPDSFGVTVFAFDGKDCAFETTTRRAAPALALVPCALSALSVVDEQGAPVRDAVVRFKLDDDRRELPSLADGRLFVPTGATGIEVQAPGFLPRAVEAAGARVVLKALTHFELRVRTADGVFAPGFRISERRRFWAVSSGGLYDTDAMAPLAQVRLPGQPDFEVRLDQPKVSVVLPELQSLDLLMEQDLIAPSLQVSRDRSFTGRRNTYRFWKPATWPRTWVRTCQEKRCWVTELQEDGGVSGAAPAPVAWQVSALRADGGVSRGGSVSLTGGLANEEGWVELDQVGAGTVKTSSGWFWTSGQGLEGRWCRSGEPCLLRAAPPGRAPGTLVLQVKGPQLEGVQLEGGGLRELELENGVAEVELPAGAHQLVLGATRVVRFSLDAGQRLALPVTLEAPRALDFEVRGPSGPLPGATVEVGLRWSSGRFSPGAAVQADAAGRVHLEGWRPGNVPLLVSAEGHGPLAVDGATLDGGVLLPRRRWVWLEHRSEGAQADVDEPAPPGYPEELWSGSRGEGVTLGADAGLEVPAGPFTAHAMVQSNALGWVLAEQSVPANAGSIDLRVPQGGARAVMPQFGSETRADVIPGPPLSEEALRRGTWRSRAHAWCLGQFEEASCQTTVLPPGPATVVLEPPTRARGPSLVWRVEVPDSGVVLLSPPPDARAF
ncbi:MAG: carboxypeptidase-like regulatory domain-containing protein [Archangium sp.]|nr:carboxypeptidase-like regulatory domain-containing protein [Archangium sp.]